MYLLDTMVVSEPIKSRPAAGVAAWLRSVPPESQFVSALSLGEVLYGIRCLPSGRRRNNLRDWHRDMLTPFFGPRTLPIDLTVADVWSGMRANARRTLSQIDGLIAATALAYDLTLVTRNERHFADLGVRIINPWVQ